MSDRDQQKVTVAKESREEPFRPSSWLVLGVVALGGVAIGWLFGSGSSLPQSEDATPGRASSSTTETETTTTATVTSSVAAQSVADQVGGFSGTLFLVRGQEEEPHSQVLAIWEASDLVPFEIRMPGNNEWDSASLDPSGTRLLAIDQNRIVLPDGVSRRSLWVDTSGRLPAAPSFQPVAVDVTGAVWHREVPGALTWVEAEGSDRWTLKTAFLDTRDGLVPQIVADFDQVVAPVWWDDTIVVLAGLPGRGKQDAYLVVLDSTSGEVLGEGAFYFVTRLADGGLVVETVDGDPENWATVLTDVSLTDSEPSPWAETGETILWMATSPGGGALGGITAKVDDIDELAGYQFIGERRLWIETEDGTFDIPTDSSAGIWSADGRWLVVPIWDDYAAFNFIDTTDGTVTRVDLNQRGRLVAVGP